MDVEAHAYEGMRVCFGFFLLIGLLYCIAVWFTNDQRTNIMKTHVLKRLDYAVNLLTTLQLNNKHIWENTCTNKHALWISRPNPWKVQLSI